jgi:hypothetical protein
MRSVRRCEGLQDKMSDGSHGRLKNFKWLEQRRNMSVLDNLSEEKRYEGGHDLFLFDARVKFVNLYRPVYL